MNLFQNSHVDLMVRPLYFLANMFGECYAMDVTRQKLSPSNLQEIKDALQYVNHSSKDCHSPYLLSNV